MHLNVLYKFALLVKIDMTVKNATYGWLKNIFYA